MTKSYGNNGMHPNSRLPTAFLIILLLSTIFHDSDTFILRDNKKFVLRHRQRPHELHLSSPSSDEEISVVGVVARLTYSGPYACLGLNFPRLKSTTQQETDEENGVSINFVLDTGANVNAISKDLASNLGLTTVIRKDDLSIIGSAGAGGSFQAGDIVMLGDCQLSGMPTEQANVTFMTNVTAASLDLGIKSIGCGLLGTSFFECFPAGVEFDWYGTDGDPPTMIFYYGKHLPDDAKKNAFCVPLEEESFFGVPAITININGVNLRAIIDTGSPISILSPKVAEKAGLEIIKYASAFEHEDHGPFIKIRGIDQGTVDLAKASKATVCIGDISLENVQTLFIGELPGLAMASNFTTYKGPQALIGLDILRLTYRMILRLSEKEVWFEPLKDRKLQ